jgi:CRISPR-associated protein Cas2
MMVLITYDVSTVTESGQRRLRKVAKECQNYGQRVQNSVFECVLNEAQFIQLQNRLSLIIDKKLDSIRFYRLGKNWNSKVEFIGKVTSYDVTSELIV